MGSIDLVSKQKKGVADAISACRFLDFVISCSKKWTKVMRPVFILEVDKINF